MKYPKNKIKQINHNEPITAVTLPFFFKTTATIMIAIKYTMI